MIWQAYKEAEKLEFAELCDLKTTSKGDVRKEFSYAGTGIHPASRPAQYHRWPGFRIRHGHNRWLSSRCTLAVCRGIYQALVCGTWRHACGWFTGTSIWISGWSGLALWTDDIHT